MEVSFADSIYIMLLFGNILHSECLSLTKLRDGFDSFLIALAKC